MENRCRRDENWIESRQLEALVTQLGFNNFGEDFETRRIVVETFTESINDGFLWQRLLLTLIVLAKAEGQLLKHKYATGYRGFIRENNFCLLVSMETSLDVNFFFCCSIDTWKLIPPLQFSPMIELLPQLELQRIVLGLSTSESYFWLGRFQMHISITLKM